MDRKYDSGRIAAETEAFSVAQPIGRAAAFRAAARQERIDCERVAVVLEAHREMGSEVASTDPDVLALTAEARDAMRVDDQVGPIPTRSSTIPGIAATIKRVIKAI